MGRRGGQTALDNRIRQRRQAAGLSQQALATRCGLTRQAINAIEAGQYVPSTLFALRLARALGSRVEDLFRLPEECPRVEAEWVEPDPRALQTRDRVFALLTLARIELHRNNPPAALAYCDRAVSFLSARKGGGVKDLYFVRGDALARAQQPVPE